MLQVHTSNVITQPGWQGFYSSSLAIDSAVCITFSRRLKGQGSAHGAYRFGQTFSLVFGSATLGKAAIITMAKADSALRTSRVVPHPSTNRALQRSASEVEQDPVHSTLYDRQRSRWVQVGPRLASISTALCEVSSAE